MGAINLQVKYGLNTNFVISAEEIRSNYLFGLNLEKFGKKITDSTIEYYLGVAQQQVESLLQVKLNRQMIVGETTSFFGDDFGAWGFIRARYPIVCPLNLTGFLGTIQQVQYPVNWLSVAQPQDQSYSRQMHIVPNTNSLNSQAVVYSGLMPNTRFMLNSKIIPNYWNVSYVTGFDPVPQDIVTVVAILTVINVLAVLSDALIRYPGLASSSVSLDGLSQSTSTFANANAGIFGARLKQYGDMLNGPNGLLSYLKDHYNSPVMTTM